MTEVRSSADRLRVALAAAGIAAAFKTFPGGTRTARDAATAIGCTVAQIAKSLVFRRADTDRPVLVVTSGVNRVDERTVGALLDCTLRKAGAAFVRETTGFAIGGVAPAGHIGPIDTILDADLRAQNPIWVAAGSPNTVFSLTFDQLAALTGGLIAPVQPAPVKPH